VALRNALRGVLSFASVQGVTMGQPLYVGKNLLEPRQLARAVSLYEDCLLPMAVSEHPNTVLFAAMMLVLVAAHNTGAEKADQLTGALRTLDRMLREHRGDAAQVLQVLNGKEGDALDVLKKHRVVIPGVTPGVEA
jgi:hypothetical protein